MNNEKFILFLEKMKNFISKGWAISDLQNDSFLNFRFSLICKKCFSSFDENSARNHKCSQNKLNAIGIQEILQQQEISLKKFDLIPESIS